MSFFSTKKPKPPKPPTVATPEVQAAQDEAARRALLAQGRSSTILTDQSNPTQLGGVGAK